MYLVPYFISIFQFFAFLSFVSIFSINYNKSYNFIAFNLIQLNFLNLIFFNLFYFPIELTFFNVLESWSSKSFFITIFIAVLGFFFIHLLKSSNFFFAPANFIAFLFLYISFFGLFGLLYANDFIGFILFSELLTIPTFFIIFMNNNTAQIFSAFKYLIINSIGTIFFSYFFSIIIFMYGVSNFSDYFLLLQNGVSFDSQFNNFTIFILFIAISVKFGLFPFHFWIIDIYGNSTLFFLLYASTFSKVGFMIIIFELFNTIQIGQYYLFVFITIFSAFFSSIAVLRLPVLTFRNLIAYSSINNTSFFVLSLMYNDFNVVALFFLTYIASLIFLVKNFSDLRTTNFTEITNFVIDSTFIQVTPFAYALTGLAFILLSGLPPFGAFFPKLFVFFGIFHSGLFSGIFNYVFAFIFIFSSFSFLYIYFKFFFIVFFFNPTQFLKNLVTFVKSTRNSLTIVQFFSLLILITIASISPIYFYLFIF